jgi:hypothetical protein
MIRETELLGCGEGISQIPQRLLVKISDGEEDEAIPTLHLQMKGPIADPGEGAAEGGTILKDEDGAAVQAVVEQQLRARLLAQIH